jgi:hypothetical protein
VEVGTNSVTLQWASAPYVQGAGFYEIYYATEPDGEFISAGTTLSKLITNFTVEGLEPNTSYYFAVQTVSLSDDNLDNTIRSEMARTEEVRTSE